MMNKKKLYKDSKNGQISGVCAGLADYLNMDVSIVRILFVVVAFFTGVGILPYIVLMIVLPDSSTIMQDDDPFEENFTQQQNSRREEKREEEDLYTFNDDDYKF